MTSSEQIVYLPDLIGSCPFQLECNPEYETVSRETETWLHSFGIPYTEKTDKYNLWSALTFPRSSDRRLKTACDVWTLLFLADDIMDSLVVSGSSGNHKRELFENMNDCLQSTGSFQPLSPFAAALHNWWQQICLNATPSCQQRLIDTYQKSNFASLFQVADLKNRQTIPDLETYINLRRDTSYGRVVCCFVEYSLDLDIPDQCWSNEAFHLLIDYATDAAAWTNDIYSYNLEHSRGDYNLITVIQNMKPSLSIQQVFDEAGYMIIERYNDFQRLRSELPSWGDEIDKQVNQFVDGLALGIIANAVWSFETPRYFGDEREFIKRTRRLTLMIDEDVFSDALSDIEDDSKDSVLDSVSQDFEPMSESGSDISKDRTSMTSEDDLDDRESELSNYKYNESNTSEKSSRSTSNTNESQELEEILTPYFYLASLSGKRIRSKLIAAFNYWFRVPKEKLAIIDEVIGMLHNASLMIDDIEDGSELRRGEPSAHVVYGVPSTINAAELICFLAMKKAMELDHPLVGRIMIDNLIELHKGQGCDIWWRDNGICPTEDDYRRMVIKKCGGLFQLILDLLRISSPIDYSDKEIQTITDLCQCLSLLFQIRDDYCNLMSPEYTENKTYCEDLTEGKYSFIIIHALRSNPDDHRLHNILKQRTTNIERKRFAVNLMHQYGSIDYTREKCIELASQANDLIDQLRGNLMLKMILHQLMCTFDSPVEQRFSRFNSE